MVFTVSFLKILFYSLLLIINLLYGLFRTNLTRKSEEYLALNNIKARKKVDLKELFMVFVFVVFLFFVSSSNKSNPDYDSYQVIYVKDALNYDLGYQAITNFAIMCGLKYHSFRVIVFFISYACLFIFLLQIKVNKNIAIALYSIYPFFYDSIQLRNFLAFSLILVTLPLLFNGKKSGIVFFITGVVLATFVHKISIVYILLLFLRLKETKYKIRFLSLLFFLSFLFVVLCKVVPSMNRFLFSLFEQVVTDKRVDYIENKTVRFGFLLYIAMELLLLFSSYLCYKSSASNSSFSKNEKRLAYCIFQINLILGCLYPVFLITSEFYRIFRNILLVNYFIFTINKGKKNNLALCSDVFLVSGFLVSWLYQTFVDGFENVVWCYFIN